MSEAPLVVCRATEEWQLEQVHRLNYRTFVEEIPQHEPNAQRRLVDGLLARSACFVAMRDRRVVGMMTASGQRPFSLDRKIPDLDSHLPPGLRASEFRLLAVEPSERGGVVFGRLLARILKHCREEGFDIGLISATLRQIRLYRRMGFQEFGPTLGTEAAPYQGMYVTWDSLSEAARRVGEVDASDARHAAARDGQE